MRIHITGMSPRMVSRRGGGRGAVARPRAPAVVTGGSAGVRGAGAQIGPEAISRALDEDSPLLLSVADPDRANTRCAAQSAARDPERIYSPYLMSKRVKQSRQLSPRQRKHVAMAIEMLASEHWAPVLVPLHPWASPAITAKRLGILSKLIPVDVSAAIELPHLAPSDPAPLWLTDRHYSPRLLDPDRVLWSVIPIDSATMSNPAKIYSVAKGVHQGAIERMPGWWTPTPLYVAHARTVYLCDTEESQLIGTRGPYYLTSDHVEWLDDTDHRDLAQAQAAYLKETMWSSDTLSSVLTDSIGRVHS